MGGNTPLLPGCGGGYRPYLIPLGAIMRMIRVLTEKVSERKYKRKWTAVGRKNMLEGFGLRETKEREKLCVEL